MKQTDYAYSVAYIRSIENRLLTAADIESLITASDAQSAVQLLIDKGYGKDRIDAADFEILLANQLSECWSELREILPDGAPLDVLICKNDFHNLKVVLKGLKSGLKSFESCFLTPSVTDPASLIKGAANADFADYPEYLRQTAIRANDILSRTGDSQLADTVTDKAAMDYCLDEAKKSGSEFLIKYVILTNTLTDIKIAMRCVMTDKDADFVSEALSECCAIDRAELINAVLDGKNALCELVAKSGFEKEAAALERSLAEYEKEADSRITGFLRGAKYISMGIEPVISYIHSKQTEIQSVRIIMSGKLIGADTEQIRSRLRELV